MSASIRAACSPTGSISIRIAWWLLDEIEKAHPDLYKRAAPRSWNHGRLTDHKRQAGQFPQCDPHHDDQWQGAADSRPAGRSVFTRKQAGKATITRRSIANSRPKFRKPARCHHFVRPSQCLR